MFKKSTMLVLMIVALVFASSFTSQMIASSRLPSAYDPGLSIDKAFKTAKTPLLIEFYSDTCSTCQRMAPVIHDLSTERYKDRLTLVMMDIDDPNNYEIAKLFGVDELPSVYVFDFKRMKKHHIKPEFFTNQSALTTAIDKALSEAMPTAG